MSVADKLLQVNQVKQDIKQAIETRGIPMTNVAFTEYANKIADISGGGGMTYEDYARTFYLALGKLNQFSTAWEHSLTVDPLEINKAQYPNGETEGVIIPEGVTSIGNSAFQSWQANNQPLVIPNSVTSIGTSAFRNWSANNQPLVIPNSVTSIGTNAFSGWQANNQPLVIPNSVTRISTQAFMYWAANNHPLVIPNSITNIAQSAFIYWAANNQPLVIPNSVTSISAQAFMYWQANNQPLVIPDSVTSIGSFAFSGWTNVPYIEMKSSTPPTLANSNAFSSQNDAPIYVPDESVEAYKTATNWSALSSRIFSINEK